MANNCLLNYDKNGNVVVKGSNASLFNGIMSRTGNEEQALKIWSVAESNDFKVSGLSSTESNVKKFIELSEIENSKPFEKQEYVQGLNASLGNESFQTQFNNVFTNEKGEFEMDFNKMVDSGVFSAEEAETAFYNVDVIKNTWLRQKKQTIPYVETEFDVSEVLEDGQNIFGKNNKANPDEVVANVVRGVEYEELSDEIVEQIINTKSEVKQYVINPLSNELEPKVYNNTYYKLLHGIPSEANTEKLSEVIEFIADVPSEDFIIQNKDVKELFKILSIEASKIGIDFVGIENKFSTIPSEGLMKLLAETLYLSDNIEGVTEEDVKRFSEVYDEVFGSQEYSETFITDKLQNPNSVIKLKTKDKGEVFMSHGLVEIKDGFFRKVNKEQDLFNNLYESARNNGKNIFNEQFPINKRNSEVYKKEYIKRLEAYADGLISNYPYLPLEEARKLVLFEEFYKESDSVEKKASIAKFNRLKNKNNINILENGQSAVIREQIRLKMKGITLPIAISQTGVELLYEGEYTLATLQDETLKDVLMINGEIDGSLSGELLVDDAIDYKRNYLVNNPHRISEFKGNVAEHGEAIEAKSSSDFIKVGGEIYENVDGNVYQKIENDGLDRWDRKAPKQTYFPKKEYVNNLGEVYVSKPKKLTGEKLYNPLLSNPLLTEKEAEDAYKNVYSDDLLKTEC